jgi:carbohydrate-selective porin OprB
MLGTNMIEAQEADQSKTLESAGQPSPVMDVQESPEDVSEGGKGYHPEGRRIGTPTDVDRDLDFSFPKRDYVLPRLVPTRYFQWKEDIYEKYGLKLGFSYQTLYQNASDTLTGNDEAWAGWALIESRWEVLNRGQDFEGSLTAALDWRHTLGGKAEPATWGITDAGSLWPTDFAYIEWDPWVPVLYWEQWFNKDVFVFRVGNQIAGQTYDFFRFKDPRVAFSSAPFTAPASSMPFPAPGLAATFEYWPFRDSELYFEGTINDLNAEAEEYNWGDALKEKDFFYGLEVGYFWKRSQGDFDHLHLNLFYADERAEPALPGAPNEAGWGFKVMGEKQMGRFVGFGSYTYNNAEGGGFGITAVKHSTTAGLVVLKPLGFRGEIGLGTSWKQPISDRLQSQYGVEGYWKLLLLPNLWITPGVQVIFAPSFNPQHDTVAIGQIKARLFF